MTIYQILESIEALPGRYNEFVQLIINNGNFEIPNLQSNQAVFNNCNLSFWYFNNPQLDNIPAYRNAIWIKVNNHNFGNVIVWLYVHINNLGGKKVSIYSSANLNSPVFVQQTIPAYVLPAFQGYLVHFPNNGPVPFYEEMDVNHNLTYLQLYNRLIERLNLLCGGE